MRPVVVFIFHAAAANDAGPLVRALADARCELANRQRSAFMAAGADATVLVTGTPDELSFGERLAAEIRGRMRSKEANAGGAIVLGSGSIPLARRPDLRRFVAVAAGPGGHALANNRYSADVVAVSRASILAELPPLPADNALPRWLDECAGVVVADLSSNWKLSLDIDTPLDLLLLDVLPERGRAAGGGHSPTTGPRRATAGPSGANAGTSGATAGERHVATGQRDVAAFRAAIPGMEAVDDDSPPPGLHDMAPLVGERLAALQDVLTNRRAELLVAGRVSATTLRWLESGVACRVRALVEERGLHAATRLAQSGTTTDARPPRSILGELLDRDGPEALARTVANLADAAVIDTRVLLAHRYGGDDSAAATTSAAAQPSAEDRFASDLLLPSTIADPWLRALTESATTSSGHPIVLGGHSLLNGGLRLLAERARAGRA